jgi:hypothetical protein
MTKSRICGANKFLGALKSLIINNCNFQTVEDESSYGGHSKVLYCVLQGM